LRKSLVPGTVLIMVSGPYRGKRCVFLKQLKKSGLLLVNGPFRVNGVPIRRLNQAYVIATPTRIPIHFKIPAIFDDKYFKRRKTEKKKKPTISTPDDAFTPKPKKRPYPKDRKDAQRKLDDLMVPIIQKKPLLSRYLRARFSLSKAEYPHLLKF